jgi:hypothetical protein
MQESIRNLIEASVGQDIYKKNPTDNIKAEYNDTHNLFVTSYQEKAGFMLQDMGQYNLHSIKGMNCYATYNTKTDFVQQNSVSGADSRSVGT